MNAKLFLAYLRIRKLLPVIVIPCLAVTIYNQFLNYRNAFADTSPWIVEEIIYGERLTVSRHGKQFEVKLCGISAGHESRDYLRSLLNKGDGSVVVNPVKTEWGVTIAEVFVQLKPDFEREIHVNTEMVMAGVATLDNPDICPSAEYLKMAYRER